ncbi:MAG: rod shape-determining protein MreC [Thermoanaerobaculia bacterium]
MPQGPTTQLLSERGTRWLLVVVVVAQLFLIAAQLPDPGGNGSLLEATLVRAIAPLGRLVDGVYDLVGGVGDELKLRRTLLEENRRLREEVASQRQRAMEAWRLEQDLERLSRALDYVGTELGPLRAADVVFVDHRPFQRTLVLWMGGQAAERNQPVVAVDGLVGRVVLPAGAYAKVQLVTDRSASVGAMIERTRRQGVVRGVGAGSLELDFVSLQADVQVGDRVVTAGIDGIYPRGLPVGTVVEVRPGEELFHRIRLRPAVDMGQLDLVYLLPRLEVPDEMREGEPDAGS